MRELVRWCLYSSLLLVGCALGDEWNWWYYAGYDCPGSELYGYTCSGTVEDCKAVCSANANCYGFSYPEGQLMQMSCLWMKFRELSTNQLYLRFTGGAQPSTAYPAFPPVWPLPRSFSNGTTTLTVAAPQSFRFIPATPSQDLENAFIRYKKLFFPRQLGTPYTSLGPVVLPSVTVTVYNTNSSLQLGTDESYTLTIPVDGSSALISSQTVYGAFHGLETLSQLIRFDFETQTYVIRFSPWSIDDGPRFPHRELLIDSGRHYLPISTIQAVLDSMSYVKANTLHWHLVDSQSFPLVPINSPNIGLEGSYSIWERYSPLDITSLVEYARQRGIRIVVEIDMPGHAASWCLGYPEVCPAPTCPQPLSPATNKTFDLIEAIISELTGCKQAGGYFPDDVIHLGGDEVDTTCWTQSPEISQWLKDNGMDAEQGYEYFIERAQQIARDCQRQVTGWEEIWNHFGTALDKSTIIHQWLSGSSVIQQATSSGYRVVWSSSDVWYLDNLGVTWQQAYDAEPCSTISSDSCSAFVLGGGGEMWGEGIDTSDLMPTVFPRYAAIAERLWAPRGTQSAAASARYTAFRCLLNTRGVAAAPSSNNAARTCPPWPDSCFLQ
ncbi:beta-hexosaminidase 1 [Pelomyxa schiedti]|nr:beta-hexosaminidase 1 [Pelomyxa schiedti]